VEAAALVAVEAVLRVGIDVDLGIAAALLLDDLDVGHRDRGVFFAEMHQGRDLRLLIGVLGDLAAVVADRRGEAIELAGGEECDGAAHAEAHDRHRPILLELVDRGLRVAQHRAPIGVGDELARIGDLVRGIAAFEILLLAVEQRGRERGVAFGREPVAHGADVMIDAEDFLDDHDAAFGGAGWIGAIGAQLKLVG
jgi:hypothetical protein